jgi:hypothetical protein
MKIEILYYENMILIFYYLSKNPYFYPYSLYLTPFPSIIIIDVDTFHTDYLHLIITF